MAPKFMDQILLPALRAKGLTESSIETYIRNLRTLNGSCDFASFGFLRKTDAIEKVLGAYAQNTQKTMLGSIISCLSATEDAVKPAYRKTYAYYHRRMAEEIEKSKTRDTGEKTDKQKENWVSWEDVLASVERLRSEKRHLDCVVLSLYTEIPPRRNKDFFEMWVCEGECADKTRNYCVVEKGVPTKFVFHCYKTAKEYGTQTADIPQRLAETLRDYGLRVGEKLLPFQHENGITRCLNTIFGKKVGASMLRHIYLSSKYGDRRDEMIADAKAMGHSVGQQQNTYTQRD